MKKLIALLFLLTMSAVAQVPNLVRSTSFNTSAAGTNNPTVTIPATAAGNSLVVEVFGTALPAGITDSAGDTYATCGANCVGSNAYDFYVAGTFRTASSVTSVTINASNGPKGRILEIGSGGVGFAASTNSYNPGYVNASSANLSITLTKQSLVLCTGDYLGGTPVIANTGATFTAITPSIASLEASANVTSSGAAACNVTWDGSGYGKPAIVEFAIESANVATGPTPSSLAFISTPNPVSVNTSSTLSCVSTWSDGSHPTCPAITYTSTSPGVSISGNVATFSTLGTAVINGNGAGFPQASVSILVNNAVPTPSIYAGLISGPLANGPVNYSGTTAWNNDVWYTPNPTAGQPGTYSGPLFGGSKVDPIFGVKYTRFPRPTNCPTINGNSSCTADSSGYVDAYSKVNPMSADKKWVIQYDTHGWLYLYGFDGTTLTFVRRIQVNTSGIDATDGGLIAGGDEANCSWSRTPGSHLLYCTANTATSSDKVALVSYDPVLDTGPGSHPAVVVHDFTPTINLYPGCLRINNEREGEQSDDDKYFIFSCNQAGGDNDQNAFILYNRATDTVVSKSFAQFCAYTGGTTCRATANYETMAVDGSSVIISWNPDPTSQANHDPGWVRGAGTEKFDLALNYLGGISSQYSHGDAGVDVNGKPIFVQYADLLQTAASHELLVCDLSLVTNNGHVGGTTSDPANTGCQHYIKMEPTSGGSDTISGRATQGPYKGYALVSNYEGGRTPNEYAMGSLENFAYRMDFPNLSADISTSTPVTPYVELGRTHAIHADNDGISPDTHDYYAQPNGVWNIDGTYFVFTSTGDFSNNTMPESALPTNTQHYMSLLVALPISGAPPPTRSSIALTPASATIATGATQTLTCTDNLGAACVTPSYTSGNTAVATVTSPGGVVTGVGGGTATITAAASGYLGSSTIAVTPPPSNGLAVTYSGGGIQTLAYSGVTLHDATAYPADVFHISHMKTTDLSGTVLHGAGLDYGETGATKTWTAGTKTMLYTYTWGTISVQFADTASKLDAIVTLHNNTGSNVILDGAEIHPFGAHFPNAPVGFNGYPVFAYEVNAPGVTIADYGIGKMAVVVPSAAKLLYTGFDTVSGGGQTYFTPLISGTGPDNLATFYPHFERALQPGQTDTFTVSYRFSPESGTPDASDAYAQWASQYPSEMTWTDKRVIGDQFLASSPTGDPRYATVSSTNPRNYFVNEGSNWLGNPAAFQARIIKQAHDTVTNALAMHMQGVITWDAEGEQYPQTTSYICDPTTFDNLPGTAVGSQGAAGSLSPEMSVVVTGLTGTDSVYNGMRLVDILFKIQSDAGLKTGVCLRPQHLVYGTDVNGVQTLQQVDIGNNAGIIAELKRKIAYAVSHWGASLFYTDSTVDANGAPLDPAIFKAVHEAYPNVLIIPEESTPLYFAYTAPYNTFIFHTDLGTDPSVYNYYPKAFVVNMINESAPAKIQQYSAQLSQSSANGDIFLDHADYLDGNGPAIANLISTGKTLTPQSGGGTAPTVTLSSLAFSAPNPINLVTGASVTPACTATYSDGTSGSCTLAGGSFLSSSPSSATVSTTGLVNAVAAGTGTITASVGSISGTDTFTITAPSTPPPPTLTSITASLSASSTVPGGHVNVTCQLTYSDNSHPSFTGSVSSATSSVATVSGLVLTGVGGGTSAIRCAQAGIQSSPVSLLVVVPANPSTAPFGGNIVIGATLIWVKFAGEGQIVSLPPGTLVRYGVAPSSWSRAMAVGPAGRIQASNATFGDPAPGKLKELDVEVAIAPQH